MKKINLKAVNILFIAIPSLFGIAYGAPSSTNNPPTLTIFFNSQQSQTIVSTLF